MSSNKIFPPLVGGFAAAVLTTVPGIKSLGCCLIVPLASILALFLDMKINKEEPPISMKKALLFGLVTGIFAAFFSSLFDVLITYITKTNEFVETLPQTESMMRNFNFGPILDESMSMLKNMAAQIKESGFSFMYAFGIFFSNFFVDAIFGMVGGLVGMAFINKRTSVK